MLGDVNDRIESRLDLYINEHMKGDLSVKALCEAFRLTHSEIYSIFKEYLGAPPAEYVKARRLERATELLRSTEMKIGAIGQECGMPDYNYFSKVFKSAYGMSPKEYRRTSRSREVKR
jgi:AraC-like DNA-binding protein